MKIEKLDHIHILVKDREGAMKLFTNIMDTAFVTIDSPTDKVAFDNAGLELICPQQNSHFTKIMEALPEGQGLQAISVKIPNRDEAVAELEAKGVRCLRKSDMPCLKSAQMNPADAYGVGIELAEYDNVTPISLANLGKTIEVPFVRGDSPKLKIDKIDHVHIVVKHLEGAMKFFSDILGSQWVGPIDHGRVRVAFDNIGLELLQPVTQDTLFAEQMEQLEGGEGLVSIGFQVSNLDEAIEVFEANGVKCRQKRDGIPRFRGAQMDPANAYGVWFELLEYDIVPPVALACLGKTAEVPFVKD